MSPTTSLAMSTRTLRRLAVFAVAAGLVGAACGGGSDDAAEPAPTEMSQSDSSVADPTATDSTAAPAPDAAPSSESTGAGAAAADVPDILQFTSALVGGGELDAADLAGKPTAFWFWSPT